jgi:hypothetical protein
LGPARLIHAPWKPNSSARSDGRTVLPTIIKEIAIETANDPVFTAEQIGWRFALGTLVLVGAYGAWLLIPVVMMTDLEPGVKAALSGVLGATPFMSKFVALAIMGRPAYYFLKRAMLSRFRRRAAGTAE